MWRYTILLIAFSGICFPVRAQRDHDTRYYVSYERQITGRFYLSRKFTSLVFQDEDSDFLLRYRPNTTLNLGVGTTHRWATLNLAYGFGFLNPDRGRGDTRYLDLQFHSYGRKIVVDLLGQFYKGFYLAPKGNAAPENDYYLRPDLRVQVFGGALQYIFNHQQFSYRAAFLQNEWQKRSAGTFLIGTELYAGRVVSDSTIVPTAIDESAAATNLRTIRFIEVGPSAGYAYTFVYKQNFFITGAASVSLDAGVNSFHDNTGKNSVTGIRPNTLLRFSTGYNSATWSVNFLFVNSRLRLTKGESGRSMTLNAGNFRMNLVYRFKPGKRVREYLKVIQEVEEKVDN